MRVPGPAFDQKRRALHVSDVIPCGIQKLVARICETVGFASSFSRFGGITGKYVSHKYTFGGGV